MVGGGEWGEHPRAALGMPGSLVSTAALEETVWCARCKTACGRHFAGGAPCACCEAVAQGAPPPPRLPPPHDVDLHESLRAFDTVAVLVPAPGWVGEPAHLAGPSLPPPPLPNSAQSDSGHPLAAGDEESGGRAPSSRGAAPPLAAADTGPEQLAAWLVEYRRLHGRLKELESIKARNLYAAQAAAGAAATAAVEAFPGAVCSMATSCEIEELSPPEPELIEFLCSAAVASADKVLDAAREASESLFSELGSACSDEPVATISPSPNSIETCGGNDKDGTAHLDVNITSLSRKHGIDDTQASDSITALCKAQRRRMQPRAVTEAWREVLVGRSVQNTKDSLIPLLALVVVDVLVHVLELLYNSVGSQLSYEIFVIARITILLAVGPILNLGYRIHSQDVEDREGDLEANASKTSSSRIPQYFRGLFTYFGLAAVILTLVTAHTAFYTGLLTAHLTGDYSSHTDVERQMLKDEYKTSKQEIVINGAEAVAGLLCSRHAWATVKTLSRRTTKVCPSRLFKNS